jgi:hypothetical protein
MLLRLTLKRAYIVGGLTLALTLALSLALSAPAHGQNGTQTLDGEIQGTKFASLRVAVEYVPGSDGLVAHATNALIEFPSEAKVTTKGLRQCAPAPLEGTTTEQAIAQCRKARVGQGSAIADVVGTDLPATVTAFNGTPSGGNPTVVLHSRVDAASLTTVLVGTILPPAGGGGVFGDRLNVPVPPLAGGAAAIERFETTVQKKFKKGGKRASASKKKKKKKKSYIRARCGPDQTYSFRGTFDYSDAPRAVVTDEQACQRADRACEKAKKKVKKAKKQLKQADSSSEKQKAKRKLKKAKRKKRRLC